MKIKLRTCRTVHTNMVHWKKSFPFVVNPRGILIHRPRDIITFVRDGEETHYVVHYWCANQCCFDISGPRRAEVVLVEFPPKDRLLCTYCEVRAVAAGELPADVLAGRHVHVGVLRAQRVCCLDRERN